MYMYNTLEYMALSPDFDEVPEGMIAPEYDVHISDSGSRIEFKRSNVMSRAKPALEVGPCSISWKQNSLEKSLRYGLFTYILDKTTVINFP